MKVFLCGGGDGTQTVEANKRLNQVIDHAKPLLYIPLAMEYEMYDRCYEWICNELKAVDVPRIDMVRSAKELAKKNLFDYCALFIGGGNTFKLLKDLKTSGAFDRIKNYLENGGIAFGGSAGAIIFGEDLESCNLYDENTVGLSETSGFDILHGISVLCHYTNRTAKKDAQSQEYLLQISKHRKIVALPEEVTLFVQDDRVEVIGNRPFYWFENGTMTKKFQY